MDKSTRFFHEASFGLTSYEVNFKYRLKKCQNVEVDIEANFFSPNMPGIWVWLAMRPVTADYKSLLLEKY